MYSTQPSSAQAAAHRRQPLAACHLHRHQRRPLPAGTRDQRPLQTRKPGRSAICKAEGARHSGGKRMVDRRRRDRLYGGLSPAGWGWLAAGHLWGSARPSGWAALAAGAEPEACLREIQGRLRTFKGSQEGLTSCQAGAVNGLLQARRGLSGEFINSKCRT
jgi:hypothetical protein